MRRERILESSDPALPPYIRQAASRSKQPITHVAMLGGSYQLLTADQVEELREDSWFWADSPMWEGQ